MHGVNLLTFLRLFFAGLLAGFEIAVHYGFGKPPQALSEAAQIAVRQALILKLRVLAPALFLPTLALGIAVTVRDGTERGYWLNGVGLTGLALWILIRVVKTVPVNSATLEWKPEDPPENWRRLVDEAERLHVIAAWGAVTAFGCFLASTL